MHIDHNQAASNLIVLPHLHTLEMLCTQPPARPHAHIYTFAQLHTYGRHKKHTHRSNKFFPLSAHMSSKGTQAPHTHNCTAAQQSQPRNMHTHPEAGTTNTRVIIQGELIGATRPTKTPHRADPLLRKQTHRHKRRHALHNSARGRATPQSRPGPDAYIIVCSAKLTTA